MLLVKKPCINVLKITTVWMYLIWILRILLYNAIGKSTTVSYWINTASSALLFQDTLWLITKCPQTWFVCKVYKRVTERGQRFSGTTCFICHYAPNLATWMLTKWYVEGMCSLKVRTLVLYREGGECFRFRNAFQSRINSWYYHISVSCHLWFHTF